MCPCRGLNVTFRAIHALNAGQHASARACIKRRRMYIIHVTFMGLHVHMYGIHVHMYGIHVTCTLPYTFLVFIACKAFVLYASKAGVCCFRIQFITD
jgi:hypothetical protein